MSAPPGAVARGQFARFAFVGVIGFVVDSAVLYLCLHGAGFGLYSGRVGSYLAAAATTWSLNRRLTFTDADGSAPVRQWAKFLAANAVGGLVNYGSYSAVVALLAPRPRVPLAGVAVGTVAGLIFNCTASQRFVFRGRADPGHTRRTMFRLSRR